MSYAKDGKLQSCLFCDFVAKLQPKELMHEDDKCVAFLPLDIGAVQHFMIVPKEHLKTVSSSAADCCAVIAGRPPARAH